MTTTTTTTKFSIKVQRKIWFLLICSACLVYIVVSSLPSRIANSLAPSSSSSSSSSDPPLYPPVGEEFSVVCNTTGSSNNSNTSGKFRLSPQIPLIYFVTPTYSRREQVAELTRLGQTLLHVPNLHWILAEDATRCSPLVEGILQRFGIPYTHIISPMPETYKRTSIKYKPRGVSSRRASLRWIRKNRLNSTQSVIYFADDDNTYDLRLFDEIRKTTRVSMFPVGFIGEQGISSPVVRDGKVIGFTDDWFANRQFPVDMAGFAVNADFAENRKGDMPYKAGHEEDLFLRSMKLRRSEIEVLANECTEILVWHTKTVEKKSPPLKLERHTETSLLPLVNDLSDKGMAVISHNDGKELKICFRDNCDTIH